MESKLNTFKMIAAMVASISGLEGISPILRWPRTRKPPKSYARMVGDAQEVIAEFNKTIATRQVLRHTALHANGVRSNRRASIKAAGGIRQSKRLNRAAA